MMLADTMISGEWITAFVVAVITAIGAALVAWKKGEAKGRNDTVTVADPVPEIPVRRTYTPPTFAQHQDLVRRVTTLEHETKEHREYVEAQLRDIRREQGEQFVKLLNAGEVRKDAIMESMTAMANGIYSRVNQLIDSQRSAPNRKP